MKTTAQKCLLTACLGSCVWISGGEAKAAGPFLDWLLGRPPAPVPVGAPQYIGGVPAGTPGYMIPNQQTLPPGYQPQQVPASGYNPAPSYSSSGVPVVANYGTPVTGIPQTQVAHLPNVGYASQWNRAAVTNYRPVTSLDPATGTTVTRMMPCTSYELQSQRIPVLSMRPAAGNYYPQASRWPSLTSPSYGPTPVPSSVPVNPAQPYSTNYVPNYGAPLVQTGPATSNGNYPLTPIYGQGVYQATNLMPVAPASMPVMPYPANTYQGNTWPTSPVPTNSVPSNFVPMNGAVGSGYAPVMPSTPIQTYSQPLPQGYTYAAPGTVPSSYVPNNYAPSTYPSQGFVPSQVLPADDGRFNQGWGPAPGLSAPPSSSTTPLNSSSNSIEDENSVNQPRLERSRENSMNSARDARELANNSNRFPLRNLSGEEMNDGASSVSAKRGMVRIEANAPNPFPKDPGPDRARSIQNENADSDAPQNFLDNNEQTIEAPSLLEPSKQNFDFDNAKPIPAPANMQAPRFNPSLLGARDLTAANSRPQYNPQQPAPKSSIAPSRKPAVQEGNMRWVSAEIDRPRQESKTSSKENGSILKQPAKR